jgi:hypothetical protein
VPPLLLPLPPTEPSPKPPKPLLLPALPLLDVPPLLLAPLLLPKPLSGFEPPHPADHASNVAPAIATPETK